MKLLPGAYQVLDVSFGGAVSLALARGDRRCRGVVLIDTPFTAAKLWHNHAFLRSALAKSPDNRHARRFAWEVYGVTEHAGEERSFWHLLDHQEAQIAVLTGDVAMAPQREIAAVPCCLDEQDLHELARRNVRVVQTRGGHDLIHDNPAAVSQLMQEQWEAMPSFA